MTHAELAAAVELYASLGRTHVPVPISIWREHLMATKPVKGRPVTKDGKTMFEPAKPRLAPVLAAGKRHKADRVEAGLRKNRESKLGQKT